VERRSVYCARGRAEADGPEVLLPREAVAACRRHGSTEARCTGIIGRPGRSEDLAPEYVLPQDGRQVPGGFSTGAREVEAPVPLSESRGVNRIGVSFSCANGFSRN